MFRCYDLVDGRVQSCPEGQLGIIQVYSAPTEEEKRYLIDQCGIDEHTLLSALDEDEISRVEFEHNHIAVIMKRPRNFQVDRTMAFKVSSIGAFLFKDRIIVLQAEPMPLFEHGRMGTLCYVYDLAGFLHWGFNFYYSQYSRRLIDPFACTDADGAFPGGDPFLVYPGENGEPLDSIRHEVFFDALQDLRALELLEGKLGREGVLEFLKEGRKESFRMKPIAELRDRLFSSLSPFYFALSEQSEAKT